MLGATTSYRLKSSISGLSELYTDFVISFIEFYIFKIITRIIRQCTSLLRRFYQRNSIHFIRSGDIPKNSASIDEMREVAARICRDYLHGAWKTVNAEDIKFRRISGGLSNFLYYVSLPDGFDNNNSASTISQQSIKRLRRDSSQQEGEPKEVLLRIYGQSHGDSAMLTELVVFTLLSERNLGPKLHGIFPGGRIEQYIPARPLKTGELAKPGISMKIAAKMAKIHSLNLPISKEPEWMWKSMGRWLKNIKTVFETTKHDCSPHNRDIIQEIRKTDLSKEVEWLKSVIESSNYPVLFCHNDLQEGNILVKGLPESDERLMPRDTLSSEHGAMANGHTRPRRNDIEAYDNGSKDILNGNISENLIINGASEVVSADASMINGIQLDDDEEDCDLELIIIDYEYCAYNYRGFDIANHFVEWTIDYTSKEFPYFYHSVNKYPTIKQREDFIVQYLRTIKDSDTYVPSQEELDEINEEISCFTMASHLFWALWAIVNVHQVIEFGYWDYALSRLREYLVKKKEFISLYRAHKPLDPK
ncbi:choline/ethanolamine kinase isoform X3 [Hermetia illucens]|uniref:choline/ethanolamine kinase isoform X3 n=1 Tax=Hermetia illucens TaxID=343691 RepID=UPI0018CC4B74|nr:choline/ethanolamine kinase isoform X3 [Hermetia illucens]